MNPIKLFIILAISLFSFQLSSAQSAEKTDNIKVNGNCGMCKKNIGKSALASGASLANWDKKTKFLQVTYGPAVTNPINIQTAIATAGYDTRDVKVSDIAYFKLEECCQYDRTQPAQ